MGKNLSKSSFSSPPKEATTVDEAMKILLHNKDDYAHQLYNKHLSNCLALNSLVFLIIMLPLLLAHFKSYVWITAGLVGIVLVFIFGVSRSIKLLENDPEFVKYVNEKMGKKFPIPVKKEKAK